VFEAFSNDSKGECLDARHGFFAVCSVAEYASKVGYFCQPPAVTFMFELDRKGHSGTVTSGPAV